jgi:hypothetical protein
MTKEQYIKVIERIIKSPRNDLQKIAMLKYSFETYVEEHKEFIYYRLYGIAMENLPEIAEEMLDTAYYKEDKVKCWYTLDGKEFTNKLEAIDHQIEYLLEEDNE